MGSIAELYHRETKYSPGTIGNLPQVDFAAQPEPFKGFHSDRAVDLTPFVPFEKFPLERDPEPAVIPTVGQGSLLARLSRVLYFTNGPTGVGQTPVSQVIFRAAPSAGALYPTEIYLVTEGVEGAVDGFHDYSVRDHALVPIFDGKFRDELARVCFRHPAFEHARAVCVLTGNYSRSSWRYSERCYRRILLDTGHVLGNLTLAAKEEGFAAVPVSAFLDDEVNQLFFLDPEEEAALMIVPLVEADQARKRTVRFPMRRSPAVEFSADASRTALYRAFHDASSIAVDEPVENEALSEDGQLISEEALTAADSGSPGKIVPLPRQPPVFGQRVSPVIARRRSTRAFTGDPIAGDVFARVLEFGYTPVVRAAEQALQTSELIDSWIIAQSVDGWEPGVYRYRPHRHELFQRRRRRDRNGVSHFCLDQEIGRDSSALVIHTANLRTAVEIYGDRAYRALHMDAGVIGEYLNLAAIRLGLGVSGIGGFYDDEVNAFLGISSDHAILYITAIGDPDTGPPTGF